MLSSPPPGSPPTRDVLSVVEQLPPAMEPSDKLLFSILGNWAKKFGLYPEDHGTPLKSFHQKMTWRGFGFRKFILVAQLRKQLQVSREGEKPVRSLLIKNLRGKKAGCGNDKGKLWETAKGLHRYHWRVLGRDEGIGQDKSSGHNQFLAWRSARKLAT